ncbi:MAG: translocation/assembly module TamB domain-containing protein, partial [Proteobacteria bacterium]|nr:translocation/assembly module TamB domain-containing protein [Pseudomonadota bacterium]
EVDLRGNIWNPELHGSLETSSGKIFFRDNTFTLNSARVDFLESAQAANGIDPLIEVLAQINEEDMSVKGKLSKITLQTTGPLSDLKVSLSSDPSRDEADILSFLAYGVFLEDLRGKGGGITAMEAGSLVVGKAIGPLEGKLAKLTRIDQVRIEPAFSESTNTTLPRLLMRKRLGEDLDLIYTTEIGGSLNRKFTANYRLTDWVSWGLKWDNEESQDRYGNVGTDLRVRIPFQ